MSMSRMMLAGILLTLMAVPVSAGPQYLQDGLALGGYDVVAYFTESQAVEGSSDYTHQWNGAEWYFSSAENRDLFRADPTHYAPAYDGHCAYGVAKKQKVPGDPRRWTIYNDQLYVNINWWVKTRWELDIPGYLEQSETNWQNLESQPAASPR